MTAFLVALGVAVAATPAVAVALQRRDMLDVPNARSLHDRPVPRGGGIAVAAATVVGMIVGGTATRATVVLLIGAVILGTTGLVDDRRHLPAAPRLLVQVVTPLAAALVVSERTGVASIAVAAVAVVVAAGFVNAFNFMDGINGISAAQVLVGGGFLALVARHAELDSLAVAAWAVAGAGLGFLPFNAVRARIFLGDVGSYFLGFWLAGLGLLLVDAGAPAAVVAAPFLLDVLDTATVVVRRARRGAPLTEAHREHAYQRLVQLGWSHVAVASFCAAVSAVACAVMYATLDADGTVQGLAFVVCVALVAGYLATPAIIERTNGGPATAST